MRNLKSHLPEWIQDWLEVIVPGAQMVLILAVAWALQRLLRRLLSSASARYQLPAELLAPIQGLVRWTVLASAMLLVLERLGMSATVLWTAFTGFATVGAVAFFAAWSVLSNLFCALLIFTARPFRIGDTIELLDTAEKPGAKGRVVDINLLYTTLQEHSAAPGSASWLQIPNALIFQRVVRRFQGVPAPATTPSASVEPASEPALAAPAAADAGGNAPAAQRT
ncbi:MAG TPA: mechanosensitive ion channel family protein [Acidovorax sp.]|nr:mechanosensitive ion channel family protein [Acidovorax sp.]